MNLSPSEFELLTDCLARRIGQIMAEGLKDYEHCQELVTLADKIVRNQEADQDDETDSSTETKCVCPGCGNEHMTGEDV